VRGLVNMTAIAVVDAQIREKHQEELRAPGDKQ
jgi:hypothetical protein